MILVAVNTAAVRSKRTVELDALAGVRFQNLFRRTAGHRASHQPPRRRRRFAVRRGCPVENPATVGTQFGVVLVIGPGYQGFGLVVADLLPEDLILPGAI